MRASNRSLYGIVIASCLYATGCGDEQPAEPLAESEAALFEHMHPTRLLSAVSGLCLGGVGGGTSNQTAVEVQTCNTFSSPGSQAWQHTDEGTLVNTASGRCLDV